jgi:hypothetical protein
MTSAVPATTPASVVRILVCARMCSLPGSQFSLRRT